MKKVEMETVSKTEVKLRRDTGLDNIGEYPMFNECEHTIVDLEHLRSEGEEWMHTFSVKLPNGRFVTMCVMQPSESQSCIDVRFSRDEEKEKTWAVGFKNGSSQNIKDSNLYSVVCDVKGE
jgi:hypothetical protein